MKKSNLNINKQFMIGNGILAFAVIAIIIIFIYMSFRFKRDADKKIAFDGVYNIEIANNFANDSLAVYINDSLLVNGIMPDTTMKMQIKRFSEDNVLIVVDKKSDRTSPYNLSKEGSKVVIKKKDGMIFITETNNENDVLGL